MIDWRPIETVPTDGTRVLLWSRNKWARLRGCYVGDVPDDATHWAPITPPEGK